VTDPSYAARFASLAAQHPDQPAATFGDETATYGELHRWSNRLARHLAELGVATGDFVTIAEPNSLEFLAATLATWKLGATPQPVSSRLPGRELEAIIDLAEPAAVVGVELTDRPVVPRGFRPSDDLDDSDLPDAVAPAWKAPTSGGSTGRPKLIVSGDPAVWTDASEALATSLGAVPGGVMVMPGPLYHNGPFIWSCMTLLQGGHLVLLARFDAEATLAAIDRHRGTALYVVPTMMQRIWKLPEDVRASYDVSSLRTVWHLAAPCPAWLKEAWIDWLGADVIWELYGGTEGQASTILDGNEWLTHRGSVGRPRSGEIRIQAEDGTVLPSGEIGEVWMRPTGRDTPTYRYIGAEAESRDGWECLGDIGWIDEDGYLYLADRRSDMILVGGANIYPAEIEAVIGEHPRVRSCAVIGLPDDDLGNRVHAIVEADGPLDEQELQAFLGERLVRYKLPRTIELVDEPLRDDAGKVRRSALRAERLPAS
jgi:bile acid-coenzyme A ligase